MAKRRHRKRWGICQSPYCKVKAVGPDYFFCNTHNRQAHAKYRAEHAEDKAHSDYELACVPCGYREERRLRPEIRDAWVKSGWLTCPQCKAGSGLVTLDLADQGVIGSPWAVTASCGIPRVFIS